MLQKPLPTWQQFCAMVLNRFVEVSSFDAMEQFQFLHQTASVSQYIDQFEESMVLLKKDNPYLEDPFFIASFVRGLKQDIKHFVKCHRPKKLLDAYWFARQLEQVEPPKKLQLTLPTETFPTGTTIGEGNLHLTDLGLLLLNLRNPRSVTFVKNLGFLATNAKTVKLYMLFW